MQAQNINAGQAVTLAFIPHWLTAKVNSQRLRMSVALLAVLTAVAGGALLFGAAGTALADPGQSAITLNLASWSPGGEGSRTPALWSSEYGAVAFEGGVTSTGNYSNLIGWTGPPGDLAEYAPPHVVYTIVRTDGGTYADVSIGTDGSIDLLPYTQHGSAIPSTNHAFVSLEGIHYIVPSLQMYSGYSCVPLPLNTSNWHWNSSLWGADQPSVCSNGVSVQLTGGVTETSWGGSHLIGTIPGGDQNRNLPTRDVYEIVHTYEGTYADVEVDTYGNIWLLPSPNTNTSFLSLASINYTALKYTVSSSSGSIPLNQSAWTSYDGYYGATTPGYSFDGMDEADGLTVHLYGAVAHWGSNSTLIGTLPSNVRPSDNVYTVVHTYGGTYADLEIDTAGNIWLLPNPTTNSTFVSLEGVTFPVV